jgi:hypothetical protein
VTAVRRAGVAVPPPPPPSRGRAAAKPRRGRGGGGGAASGLASGLGRWWKVALLVALVLLGLPLAHALMGEVVALLGGAALFGFLLGRWTAPAPAGARRR